MGKLSSTGVQELAHAAKADGLSHPEMVELASLRSVLLGRSEIACKKAQEIKVWRLERKPCTDYPGVNFRC